VTTPWDRNTRVAVVVPCYRVHENILQTLDGIGPEVSGIFVVDDACPDGSGDLVEERTSDSRITVLRHEKNKGVGGAVLTGYRAALEDGATIVVKLDGDGQVDPRLIPKLLSPLVGGQCDYVKGNRFFNPEDLAEMPRNRLFGNAVLSFLTKMSSGYWSMMDPTNGFTAISTPVLRLLPLTKISNRYFFESDMLFRLNTVRAVVMDVPMRATYAGSVSSLRTRDVILPFLSGHVRNTLARIFYGYFLRGFSIASIELLLSVPLIMFGTAFGLYHWIINAMNGVPTLPGTVMVAALPIVIGMQLLLAFIAHDMQAEPRLALTPLLDAADARENR